MLPRRGWKRDLVSNVRDLSRSPRLIDVRNRHERPITHSRIVGQMSPLERIVAKD